MEQDHYAMLGVDRDATPEEIKRKYRQLARELHPDGNTDPDAESLFKPIVLANAVLSKPEKRRAYDLENPSAGRRSAGAQGVRPPLVKQGRTRSLWTDLHPPVLDKAVVTFKPLRRNDFATRQVEIRIHNPNEGQSLKPALRAESGRFWRAKLHKVDSHWLLLVTTTWTDFLAIGQHHDTLEIYWASRPDVLVRLFVSATVEQRLPHPFNPGVDEWYVEMTAQQRQPRQSAARPVEQREESNVVGKSEEADPHRGPGLWVLFSIWAIAGPAVGAYLLLGGVSNENMPGLAMILGPLLIIWFLATALLAFEGWGKRF